MNKKNIILILCLVCGMAVATTVSAQGKLVLREDNIEEILNAMTIGRKSPCWSAALEVLCLVRQAIPAKSSVSASR